MRQLGRGEAFSKGNEKSMLNWHKIGFRNPVTIAVFDSYMH